MELGLLTLGDHRPDPKTGGRITQAERHANILDYIACAEPAGFDAVVIGEHHFSDFIVSSPQIFLAWAAAQTSSIRLATGVTLLAHHDTVRLAEDFATLDVVSNGRAEMWVGKGVEPATYRQFGQDSSRAPEMQEEGLRLLMELWTKRDVTWSGEFRPPLDGVTLEPRPVQQPHPPIYVSSTKPASAAVAGTLGLGLTVTMLSFERDQLPRVVDAYLEAFAAAGHAHTSRITLHAHVHVAPTTAEARAHLGIYQFPFQRWVFAKHSGSHPDDVELPTRITDLDAPECAIVSGSPEEVCDRIAGLRALAPFDRFIYQGDYGGQPWPLVRRSLDLFVGECMAPIRGHS